MKISYYRVGGFMPPPDNEQLEIVGDGSFTLWRSVGWTTQPPTPVGRFAGKLDGEQNAALQREAQEAADAGNLNILLKPDSPLETISIEGSARAQMGIHDKPDGRWWPLVARLRALLGALTAFPRAAIALEVLPGGRQARLVHQGQETLQLDLSKLNVRAVLWVDYVPRGDWAVAPQFTGTEAEVSAGPGWSLGLPFEHGFEIEEKGRDGSRIAAYVNFGVVEGDWPIPVSLEAST
jgi:hypothetical protein